ncbi:hypothetical protein F5Y15DRAFT_31244 [Xylariaceae sp. FL0016]|nr:hypothetical protein F5Y15DRAFT_31244 [Xylariaceae sp. FL0016]
MENSDSHMEVDEPMSLAMDCLFDDETTLDAFWEIGVPNTPFGAPLGRNPALVNSTQAPLASSSYSYPDVQQEEHSSTSPTHLDLLGLEQFTSIDWMNVDSAPGNSLSLSHCPGETSTMTANDNTVSQTQAIQGKPKGHRTKISNHQRIALESWISHHTEPYPTKDEKLELSRRTGLTEGQISSWFSRTRQRRLERVKPIVSGNEMIAGLKGPMSCYRNVLPAPAGTTETELQNSHFNIHQARPNAQSYPQPYNDTGEPPYLEIMPRKPEVKECSRSVSLPLRVGETQSQETIRAQSQPPVFNLGHMYRSMHAPRLGLTERLSLDVIDSRHNGSENSGSHTSKKSVTRASHPMSNLAQSQRQDDRLSRTAAWIQEVSEYMQRSEEPSALSSLAHAQNLPFLPEDSQGSNHNKSSSAGLPGAFDGKAGVDRAPSPSPEAPQCPKTWDSQLDSAMSDLLSRSIENTPEYRSLPPPLSPPQNLPGGESRASEYSFDATSDHRSSMSSAASASSFLSFGSRKGRRVAFCHSTPGPPSEQIHSVSAYDQGMDQEAHNSSRKRTASEISTGNGIGNYYCPFCKRCFKTKYAWKRHEESTHAPQKIWICASSATEIESCLLSTCPSNGPETLGLNPVRCTHGFQECWQKPELKRTFYGGMPSSSTWSRFIWSETVKNQQYDMRCHFCGFIASNWTDRVEHIAAHFEKGFTMDDWRPRGPYCCGSCFCIAYEEETENHSCPPSQRGLACPFYRKDPAIYRCGRFEASFIKELTEHFYKTHLFSSPSRQCQSCLKWFKTRDDFDEHLFIEDCCKGGLTPFPVFRVIFEVCESKVSVEDKWYQIWKIIAPGEQVPWSLFVCS